MVCKICNLKFKEINNDHLLAHNICCDEYDKIYGENMRVSEKTSKNKNTIGALMTSEFSLKLSNSHKLENYIIKYGEVEGHIKHDEMKKNKSYRNGSQSYIDKYGELEGLVRFKKVQDKKVISLQNQINKHGEKEGTIRYNIWLEKQKKKNCLSFFVGKHGYEDGLKKWMEKNNKISISNSKIDKEDKRDFTNYVLEVSKYTRISLNMNDLLNIESRGFEGGCDLDHIVSKVDGFKNKIPAYVIGHISNLKIVDSSYNRRKQHNSDMGISIIVDRYENDIDYKKLISDMMSI